MNGITSDQLFVLLQKEKDVRIPIEKIAFIPRQRRKTKNDFIYGIRLSFQKYAWLFKAKYFSNYAFSLEYRPESKYYAFAYRDNLFRENSKMTSACIDVKTIKAGDLLFVGYKPKKTDTSTKFKIWFIYEIRDELVHIKEVELPQFERKSCSQRFRIWLKSKLKQGTNFKVQEYECDGKCKGCQMLERQFLNKEEVEEPVPF